MLKIIEMLSKGINIFIIFRFLAFLLPFMLSYSIPISILTAVLLVFARLSADNEITAIRASGINLKHICTPVIFSTILLMGSCYFINDQLRPNSIFAGRKLLLQIGMQEPTVYIPSGRFYELFSDHLVYIGKKKGDMLQRVVVYKFEHNKLDSVITAERGRFFYESEDTTNENGKEDNADYIHLKLYNGVMEKIPRAEAAPGQINRIHFNVYIIKFDLKGQFPGAGELSKKEREMTNRELEQRVKKLELKRNHTDYGPLISDINEEISSIKTRIHNRLAISFSCLAFILVGIPLGIRVHRSETSIGAGISLLLVGAYYFLMTLGEAFQEEASLHPWLFMWVPNIILFTIGVFLIRKMLQK